jgi:hypothetical protein
MKLKSYIISILLCCITVNTWATDAATLNVLKTRLQPYMALVAQQPDWLLSRLQMYWNTHSTDVLCDAETYSSPGTQRAPVPTVKYNGTRSTMSYYDRPKLEDVIPYDDDAEGKVTFINKSTGQMEKTSPAKTGCNIAALNISILSLARDASIVYQSTGDEQYARMAYGVFDTYLQGIYYRNVPTDLTHGHMQTLYGLTTFEVIHEDALTYVCEIYRNLGSFIKQHRDIYDGALQHWADNIIANGVPHNNWDLYQAEFVASAALALQSDSHYTNGHGREYYLNYIMHESSIRQWSIPRLADFGFDKNTHIWYEAPGYSLGVLTDFASFANLMDEEAGVDMVGQLPQLIQAELAMPQYLMPNRMFCGFGDSHPNYLKTSGIDALLKYAARHHNDTLTAQLTTLRNAITADAPVSQIAPFVSASFYAPNVSWLIQRSGMDAQQSLCISLNASLGNHQHSNGISMELYGCGYVLGPDAGIGRNLYSGDDYKEYYSQFPAHNTVCVDGVSSYPAMMSQHAFQLQSRYPDTNEKGTFAPATYSIVNFVEPESQSDQQRTCGIITADGTASKSAIDQIGYYVDIFRSHKKKGGDKTHDYFYHNLGQQLSLYNANGDTLAMQPTDQLAFAGGHLYAYSYIYNKQSADMKGQVRASFITQCKDNSKITMNLWMRGDSHRQVIRALSPVNLQYERMPNQPYKIDQQPVLTLIARQQGEAWNHPFVCIYEPSKTAAGNQTNNGMKASHIRSVDYFSPSVQDSSAVGIIVRLDNGDTHYIFSAAKPMEMSYLDMHVTGTYAVFTPKYALLGEGTRLHSRHFDIQSNHTASQLSYSK